MQNHPLCVVACSLSEQPVGDDVYPVGRQLAQSSYTCKQGANCGCVGVQMDVGVLSFPPDLIAHTASLPARLSNCKPMNVISGNQDAYRIAYRSTNTQM